MFLLWLCVYFLRNGSGNRLRQITGWVLLVWVIQSVKDMALIWYPTVRFEFLHHVFVLIDMTAVPTCAFLLFELTRPGSMTLRRAVLHEIPFFLFSTQSIPRIYYTKVPSLAPWHTVRS